MNIESTPYRVDPFDARLVFGQSDRRVSGGRITAGEAHP
jgi:hypothetical protein